MIESTDLVELHPDEESTSLLDNSKQIRSQGTSQTSHSPGGKRGNSRKRKNTFLCDYIEAKNPKKKRRAALRKAFARIVGEDKNMVEIFTKL